MRWSFRTLGAPSRHSDSEQPLKKKVVLRRCQKKPPDVATICARCVRGGKWGKKKREQTKKMSKKLQNNSPPLHHSQDGRMRNEKTQSEPNTGAGIFGPSVEKFVNKTVRGRQRRRATRTSAPPPRRRPPLPNRRIFTHTRTHTAVVRIHANVIRTHEIRVFFLQSSAPRIAAHRATNTAVDKPESYHVEGKRRQNPREQKKKKGNTKASATARK